MESLKIKLAEDRKACEKKLYRFEDKVSLPVLIGEASEVSGDYCKVELETTQCPDCAMEGE